MLPADPYLYHEQTPQAGGARPLSQGDVFVDIPLVRAARRHAQYADRWQAAVKVGPNALGMLVTHPCSSRRRVGGALKPTVSVAPVVKCPENFKEPWIGYYEYFPLPALCDGKDYVADLSAICPVEAEQLAGKRLACLNQDALATLFHRLALNSSRLDVIPDHFAAEAQRLCFEMSLWERWTTTTGTEHGFQEWLDEGFPPPPVEDEDGRQLSATDPPAPTSSRREVLRWHYEQIEQELKDRPADDQM